MKRNKTVDRFLGKTFTSNNYGEFVVIEYQDCSNVTIKFINTGSVRTADTSQIRGGGVRDFCAEKVVKSKTNNIIHKVGNRGDDKSLTRGVKK